MSDYLSFRLGREFVGEYRNREVPWGYVDAVGTPVSEIVFFRTYSRLKEDGNKETWVDVCERVINGMISLQKDHAKANKLPWNDRKAHATAEEAFRRMFEFKWTPPGRGLWMMGTELVNRHRNSAALMNCGFVSTADIRRDDPGEVFAWLMEASMLGIGVGFDTKGETKGIEIQTPSRYEHIEGIYRIEDSREGWVESTRLLINAYLAPGRVLPQFDYSLIRPAGTPIKTFGGTAAGPEPLMKLHTKLREIFESKTGQELDSLTIMDIANLIGVCVVSGNVRRRAGHRSHRQPEADLRAPRVDGLGRLVHELPARVVVAAFLAESRERVVRRQVQRWHDGAMLGIGFQSGSHRVRGRVERGSHCGVSASNDCSPRSLSWLPCSSDSCEDPLRSSLAETARRQTHAIVQVQPARQHRLRGPAHCRIRIAGRILLGARPSGGRQGVVVGSPTRPGGRVCIRRCVTFDLAAVA